MNARSLKFQLITWYAGVLTGCFAFLAVATYLVLQTSLIGALKENQLAGPVRSPSWCARKLSIRV
jgi:hypothetical protein